MTLYLLKLIITKSILIYCNVHRLCLDLFPISLAGNRDVPKRNQSRNGSCCSWKLSLCNVGSTAAYVETYRGGKEGEEGESPKLKRALTEKALVFCEIPLLH